MDVSSRVDYTNKTELAKGLKSEILKAKSDGNIDQKELDNIIKVATKDGSLSQRELDMINVSLLEQGASLKVHNSSPNKFSFELKNNNKSDESGLIGVKEKNIIDSSDVNSLNKKINSLSHGDTPEITMKSSLNGHDSKKIIRALAESNGFDPEKYKTDSSYRDKIISAMDKLFGFDNPDMAKRVADLLFKDSPLSKEEMKFLQTALRQVGQESLLSQDGIESEKGSDGKFGARTATAIDRLFVAVKAKIDQENPNGPPGGVGVINPNSPPGGEGVINVDKPKIKTPEKKHVKPKPKVIKTGANYPEDKPVQKIEGRLEVRLEAKVKSEVEPLSEPESKKKSSSKAKEPQDEPVNLPDDPNGTASKA